VTRLRTTLMLLAATGLCVSATLVSSAGASASLVGEVTEFSTGITVESLPSKITVGREGDLWFTERNNNLKGSKVARMTPTGEVTEFPVLADSMPQGIALGPEGNLWFAEVNNPECNVSGCHSKVGRIDPTTHAVEEFSGIAEGSQPWEITAGSNGNLWFTEFAVAGSDRTNRIGEISPKTDKVEEFELPLPDKGQQGEFGITPGPDGNVWFTEDTGNRIGRITPSGTITEFPIPTAESQPVAIVTGPDGNLWFAEQDSTKIGRITPTGTITEFPLPSFDGEPRAIAAGPDGNIWFAMDNGDIGRITPEGVVTTCTTGIAGDIEGLTAGPDESMWFAEYYEGRIGKITATGSGLAPNCTSGATPISAGAPVAAGSSTPPSLASSTPPALGSSPPPATATVTLDGSNVGVRSGVAMVKLICSGSATCVGKVTLTARSKPANGKKAKTESIGIASFSVPAGETKLIKVKLDGTGLALLRTARGNLGAAIKIAKSLPSPSKTETQSVHLRQQKAVHKN
jgi:streptogramin lyase